MGNTQEQIQTFSLLITKEQRPPRKNSDALRLLLITGRNDDSFKRALERLASLFNAKLSRDFYEPLGFGLVGVLRFRFLRCLWLSGFCHAASQKNAHAPDRLEADRLFSAFLTFASGSVKIDLNMRANECGETFFAFNT
jgi:hypothetical protein